MDSRDNTPADLTYRHRAHRHEGEERVVIVRAVLDGRGHTLPLRLVITDAWRPAKWENKKRLSLAFQNAAFA